MASIPRFTNKADNSKLIEEFLAKGGTINKVPMKAKKQPKSDIVIVEIDEQALPAELRKFLKEEDNG